MTNKASKNEQALEYGDWAEPMRDARGRFLKGYTGNRSGRPRRPPKQSWSVERAFAEALAETVPVTGPDGKPMSLALRDVIIKSFVRNCVKAKPKDQLAVVERLLKLGVLAPTPIEEEYSEEIWTEAECRLLERIEREVLGADPGFQAP